MIFLIILAYIIIGFIEITPLIKNKKNKELILYSSIFIASFVISIFINVGVEIPSPAKGIEKVVKLVTGIE